MTSIPARHFGELNAHAHDAAELLRVVGNASRLQLLCRLADGECSVSQLEDELQIRQPALSQQLAELRRARIVRTRRESRSVFYALDDARVRAVLDLLHAIYCGGGVPAHPHVPSKADAPPGDTAQFAKLGK